MKIRLYSLPHFGGLTNVGASMWVSYVSAVNGGGGDVSARLAEYTTTDPKGFVTAVMSQPRPEEIFTLLSPTGGSVGTLPLVSDEQVCLRTEAGHFVGIEHDEDDHHDYVVASALTAGLSETFVVTSIQDSALTTLSATVDPCGPSYAMALKGRNWAYLTFPGSGDGSLLIGSPGVGSAQTFAVDYLEPFPVPPQPWHSIKQQVYHDNTKCTEGNNIEKEYLQQGTGGKPRCKHCERLDLAGQ